MHEAAFSGLAILAAIIALFGILSMKNAQRAKIFLGIFLSLTVLLWIARTVGF
jgi:hypothetical protein